MCARSVGFPIGSYCEGQACAAASIPFNRRNDAKAAKGNNKAAEELPGKSFVPLQFLAALAQFFAAFALSRLLKRGRER
jgi:hypothetical protein